MTGLQPWVICVIVLGLALVMFAALSHLAIWVLEREERRAMPSHRHPAVPRLISTLVPLRRVPGTERARRQDGMT